MGQLIPTRTIWDAFKTAPSPAHYSIITEWEIQQNKLYEIHTHTADCLEWVENTIPDQVSLSNRAQAKYLITENGMVALKLKWG